MNIPGDNPHGQCEPNGVVGAAAQVDVQRLMEEIRQRVITDAERYRDVYPRLVPSAVGSLVDRGVESGSLFHSEDLRFLNQNYAYETKLTPGVVVTHRRGILGTVIVKIKRKLLAYLRSSFFQDYLTAERQFQEHLVRYLNHVSRYVDARDGELFGQLVRKIDRDCSQIAEKLHRVEDEKSAAFFTLEHDFISRLERSDKIVRGLEGLINSGFHRDPRAVPKTSQGVVSELQKPDISYLLLENRYRGAESEIERRLQVYGEIFHGIEGTVLEIGSGRGELQRLLAQRGISSYGVDLDQAMVAVANAAGCDTANGDGISHLRTLNDGSLGGLVAIQVVEHLTHEALQELMQLAKRKVRKGGLIVFETINPQSLLALSSNYFRDPTHVWPLHPDTLGYMATLAGLAIRETRLLSPVSSHALLRELPLDSTYAPALRDGIERLNANIQQLNALLYGYQDYCLVLEVVQ